MGSGVRRRVDKREAAGKGRSGLGKRMLAACVEHQDRGLEVEGIERPRIVGEANRLGRHVEIAGNRCIDRHEVVLTLELQAVAAQIDECDRVGSGGRGFLEEVLEGPPQRFLVEIAGTDHVEAGSLQGLGNKTGVVGRGRQLARLVAGIADDQRDALLVGLLRQGRRRCGQEQKDGEKEDRP